MGMGMGWDGMGGARGLLDSSSLITESGGVQSIEVKR